MNERNMAGKTSTGAMEYPTDFPKKSRDKVDVEIVTADRDFRAAARNLPSGLLTYGGIAFASSPEQEGLVVRYILRILAVFAHEACEVGRTLGWTVGCIHDEVDKFIVRLAIDVQQSDKCLAKDGWVVVNLLEGAGLRSEVRRRIENSEMWKRYESDLLEPAHTPATGESPASNDARQPDNKLERTVESECPQVEEGGDRTDRRAVVDAYIEEVFKIKGMRITRKDIWTKAGYKSRTEFERWERNDPKHPNKSADKNFTRLLREKPHLK